VDFGLLRFRGKKVRIWISDLSRFSCTVFESNKNGSYMIVFVKLFATNFVEFQQCKTAVHFCWIFVGGSFLRD